MKKISIITLITLGTLGMAACGGSGSGSTDTTSSNNQAATAAQPNAAQETTATNTGTEPANTTATAGEALMAKADCATCHKADAKVVGPAYKDIAAKYDKSDATIAKLTQKVIKGGSGNWGDVPMPAHPSLAEADVKEMVKYILSVK